MTDEPKAADSAPANEAKAPESGEATKEPIAEAPVESPIKYDSVGQAFRDGVFIPNGDKLRG
jgi:hypothetical protein